MIYAYSPTTVSTRAELTLLTQNYVMLSPEETNSVNSTGVVVAEHALRLPGEQLNYVDVPKRQRRHAGSFTIPESNLLDMTAFSATSRRTPTVTTNPRALKPISPAHEEMPTPNPNEITAMLRRIE